MKALPTHIARTHYSDLNITEKMILTVLAAHDNGSNEIEISLADLGDSCSLKNKALITNIKELVKKEYLSFKRSGKGAVKNVYTLNHHTLGVQVNIVKPEELINFGVTLH